MPNLLLTQRCVRSCPYCFAKDRMSGSSPVDNLPWEDLIYLADFLEGSGERNLSLLGGEPSLHPSFVDFLVYLLGRDFKLKVFTSGIMADAVLEKLTVVLKGVPEDRLVFICNINDPKKTPTSEREVERVKRFLGNLGSRSIPGFNIYRIDYELDFLFHLINEYGLKRTLRLGIANPIPGSGNSFITIEDIDAVVERLFSYAPLFERLRVKPGLDCGFPMCRFSDAQLGWLHRQTGGGFRFGCGPVIDIGPDMTVWSCFPLASFHKKSVYEFDSLQDIFRFYEKLIGTIRVEAGGIFEECDGCRFREEGTCSGGCVAHLLSRFQNEARVRFSEMYL